MSWIDAVFLALVQGVTEFLPVSSSAHLILPSQLFGMQDQGLAFDVAVHFGTLFAVCLYYRHQLVELLMGNIHMLKEGKTNGSAKLAWLIVAATIPAGLAGIIFGDVIEQQLRSMVVIASTTILFGLLLGFADKTREGDKTEQSLGIKDALIIGFAQALALIPGTSRSGITMTAALFLGYKRQDAASISFLLSIPIIAAAALLKTVELIQADHVVDFQNLLIGIVASFLFAYCTIALFLKLLSRLGFMPFVVYRLLLGAALFAVVFFS